MSLGLVVVMDCTSTGFPPPIVAFPTLTAMVFSRMKSNLEKP
jgi:hypothetical protein